MAPIAVIFDLDGTLLDTLGDIAAAVDHVLREDGLPTHDLGAYRAMVGQGSAHLISSALPQSKRDQATAYLRRFRARYDAHLVEQTVPFDGIEALLADLSDNDVPLAVLSNKPHAPTRRLVEALFDDGLFVDVVGQRPEFPLKPDPTTALLLRKALGVPAGQCLFVGDTEVDVQTALSAGMHAIAVTWGFRDRDALADAHHIVDDVTGLAQAIAAFGLQNGCSPLGRD